MVDAKSEAQIVNDEASVSADDSAQPAHSTCGENRYDVKLLTSPAKKPRMALNPKGDAPCNHQIWKNGDTNLGVIAGDDLSDKVLPQVALMMAT